MAILSFILEKGGSLMLESEFQNKLIQELKRMFKGCIVTKLDSSHIQGIPDLLILYNDKWATLECKKVFSHCCHTISFRLRYE